MALPMRPGEPDREPIDDYHVQPHVGEFTRPSTHHVLAVINGVKWVMKDGRIVVDRVAR